MSSLGSPNPFFIAGKKAYEVERSLRFNDNDSAYLTRTPSSASNRKTFTFSVWVKRTGISLNQRILTAYNGSDHNHECSIQFQSDNKIQINNNYNGSTDTNLKTNKLFRDPSAWYHIVLAVDMTQSTASDRVKLYVNGVQETSFSTENYGTQNYTWFFNNNSLHSIGRRPTGERYFDGYMAEINFIDGFQYDPSYFAETDAITGQWNPRKYTGSYGTNGFYLNFSDNSGTTATTLGKDSSGNGNNFTPNNFSVSAGSGNDSLEDTPTNNFPTLNPLAPFGSTAPSLSNGNLDFTMTSNNMYPMSTFTIPKSGKWYVEVVFTADSISQATVIVSNPVLQQNSSGANRHNGINYYGTDILVDNSGVQSSVTAVGLNTTIGICVDRDAGTVLFKNNNSNVGVAVNLSSLANIDDLVFAVGRGSSSGSNITGYFNFGQRPFTYTPPTGFVSLCSANLPDPTIKLPNKHFDTLLYTGNGSTQSISGLNFQPDWVWIKQRNAAENHFLTDSNRGAGLHLRSDQGTAESDDSATFTAFTSDGFSLTGSGAAAPQVNDNSDTYVAWNWDAGETDGKTYTVTVVSDSGNKYRFDGFGTSAVTLDLAEGGTYIFNYPSAHPFRFSTTADGTHGGGSEYTTGVTVLSSTSVQIVVAASAPTLYYYCSSHSGMGGAINTNSTLGSSNFDGNLQSVTKVNATAGFSIVKWTSGANAYKTVGHGLGVKPDIVILKARTTSNNWFVYTDVIDGTNDFLELNSTNTALDAESYSIVPPTSTVFGTDGAFVSGSTNIPMIAYVFSSVSAYSKIGKYTGNGNANGTFVFTGFRPAFILFKNASTATNWELYDTTRPYGQYNPAFRPLYANHSYSEETHASLPALDILSNGFKPRSTWDEFNKNGDTIIYLAFAESPFKNARAR